MRLAKVLAAGGFAIMGPMILRAIFVGDFNDEGADLFYVEEVVIKGFTISIKDRNFPVLQAPGDGPSSLLVSLAIGVGGLVLAVIFAAIVRRLLRRMLIAQRLSALVGADTPETRATIEKWVPRAVLFAVLGFTVYFLAQIIDLPDVGQIVEQFVDDQLVPPLGSIGIEISYVRLVSIVRSLVLTAASTLAFVLSLRILKRIFPVVYERIETWQRARPLTLKIQRLELLSSVSVTNFLVLLARGVRLLISVALVYLYFSLVLSFFPNTRSVATALFGYIIEPLRTVGQSFISYLPNVLFIAMIVVATHYLIKLVKFLFNAIESEKITVPGLDAELARPTYQIARFLVLAFAAIMLFPYLPGSDSLAFQGISVFLGLLFSLGSASAIGNIIAGVVLTYTRAFRVGDRVKIADTVGDVTEKTLLVTRIRTIKNVEITVPNSMVLGSHIINYSASSSQQGLILHTGVTIGYDVPWRQVHELLIAAARMTQHILEQPTPFVLQTSLDDFYVSYELNVYTDQPNKMTIIYSELHQNIQDKFNEAAVEIMSPHFAALRDGHQINIPEEYLPPAYTPPAFRFNRTENRSPEADDHTEPDVES
ncbi:MAG: mechanosensitive ion channel family protein [Anaerolineae bacterium]|nr:mechanosensitive ion channel family protein [Anaerolineae bacterium]